MNSYFGSGNFGTRLLAASLAATLLCITATVTAQETVATRPFSDAVIDLLLESRNQKPASQATSQERAAAIDELNDIYLISSLPRAIELSKTPEIAAQIELQQRAILFNALATDFLASNAATEQEIFDLYQEQVVLPTTSDYKARHILVETQSAAEALIDELNNGADFAELAMQKSTGPSGPNGGDLGWFSPRDMVPEFSDAVVEMEDGAFTQSPVQTQFGWHVILREDSREGTPPPLDSVRDAIKQRIEQEKFQKFLNNARANADS